LRQKPSMHTYSNEAKKTGAAAPGSCYGRRIAHCCAFNFGCLPERAPASDKRWTMKRFRPLRQRAKNIAASITASWPARALNSILGGRRPLLPLDRSLIASPAPLVKAGHRRCSWRIAGCSHVHSTPEHEVSTSAQNVYETLRDK
jgi:hypothetical protein